MRSSIILLLGICLLGNLKATSKQVKPDGLSVVSIGNLKLESGKEITGCKIGYRTFGKLNADKSNAILFPTWFTGTSKNIETDIRPWQFIDTTRYYLIIADALGNGISSSPSNSLTQPGALFPFISIADMVNAHHQLLVNNLKIDHLHAIIGISMGGFQCFQWAVSYPDFSARIIPVVGSPRLSGYDIINLSIVKEAIEGNAAYNNGNYKTNPNIPVATLSVSLNLTSPANVAKNLSPQNAAGLVQSAKTSSSNDWNNFHVQLLACLGQDISKTYNGSLTEAAKHIKAKMLIINNQQDHLVNPLPAIEFSKTLPAKLLLVDNELGHQGINLSEPSIKKQIQDMLESNP